MSSKANLIWIDLEMTGLSPERERIIEIGTIVTDGNLKVLSEGPNIAIHQPKSILKKMDDWNQKQHKKSGLIDLVNDSKITVKKAEKLTLDFLKEYCEPGKSPLCGNSVHYDRAFIRKYMHKLDKFLHYRHIDVSSIKQLIYRWYPKFKKFPKKSEAHRSLDDIRESIEELRFFRKNFFKKKA